MKDSAIMVLKQTTEYSLDENGNKIFNPEFVAISYDAHVVTFQVNKDDKLQITNDFH